MGGCTRIPFTAIDAWARRHDLDAEAFDLLKHVLVEMDGVFVEHAQAEAARNAEQQREEERRRRAG